MQTPPEIDTQQLQRMSLQFEQSAVAFKQIEKAISKAMSNALVGYVDALKRMEADLLRKNPPP